MNTEDATALEMLKLGYAVDDPTDQRRCLTFRVNFDSVEGAQEAARAIHSYNGFDGAAVAQALENVPTEGYPRFLVGREGSPVVYIEGFDIDTDAVMDALRDANPDELDATDRGVRAWWD